MKQKMFKYGLFVIHPETCNVMLLAMYDTATEARKNIPNDKQFYSVLAIFTSYEREDFKLGKGAEPVRSFK
jgi:hypothetical protein